MRNIELGSSGLRSSALGFGCAALMGRVGRKDSLRALAAAFDAGITFFDTARSYGYGESEALLGEFLAGRRDQVLISTKFGILPVRQAAWKRAVKPIARKVFAFLPAAQRAVKNQIAAQFEHNQFTVEVLRKSLEISLRKLRTDHVDLLFMHSPPLGVLGQEDILGEMENLVSDGKVRVAGISVDLRLMNPELRGNLPRGWALQFPCNLFNFPELAGILRSGIAERALVANLPFGGTDGISGTRSRILGLANRPEAARELRNKLLKGDPFLLADAVLNIVGRDTGIDVVVPSMMRIEHLLANVQAISNSRFSEDEIAWMRQSLVKESGQANLR